MNYVDPTFLVQVNCDYVDDRITKADAETPRQVSDDDMKALRSLFGFASAGIPPAPPEPVADPRSEALSQGLRSDQTLDAYGQRR